MLCHPKGKKRRLQKPGSSCMRAFRTNNFGWRRSGETAPQKGTTVSGRLDVPIAGTWMNPVVSTLMHNGSKYRNLLRLECNS